MKRLCGFIIFWIGIGMAIMMFLPINFWTVCIVLICLCVGYHLFCR